MRTADFLPEAAFRAHLDRRKTPMRLIILGGVAMLCMLVSGAFGFEAIRVERQATQAERPDPAAIEAKGDLQRIFSEMNEYSVLLDPLAEHLKRPTVGWILKDIANQVGSGVQIEEITWNFDFGVPLARNGGDRDKVGLTLVAVVRGKSALLELDDRLKHFTQYANVTPRRQEVVSDREGTVRFELTLDEMLGVRKPKIGGKP